MTDELIERIEAADGPDRELDAEIAQAIGWKTLSTNSGKFFEDLDGRFRQRPHHFTSSIDAALTLVPGDMMEDYCLESCFLPNRKTDGHCMAMFHEGAIIARGYAATPALAICASALKARKSND